MSRLALLSDAAHEFPPTSEALEHPNGLLAVGGDLSPARLLAAYHRGIFPWYNAGQPPLWWSPDPRAVLFPECIHVSRSLRRRLRRDQFQLQADTAFEAVMAACAEHRPGQDGTWIDSAMCSAYAELHRQGHAHCIEVYDPQQGLVGGLYGVSLGAVFFGESMFSRTSDASKVALVALCQLCQRLGIRLIDCQVESEHMNSLGADKLSRLDFEQWLVHTRNALPAHLDWTVPATCGALL